jgi:hypothetical protein
MATDRSAGRQGPTTLYMCPSCHLHLLSWTEYSDRVEMFHKVALWSDFWTGQVRMICQYCLGATDFLPERLVDLLRSRYGLYAPKPIPPHRPTETA